MRGEIALDTSVAIQLLNGKESVAEKVSKLSNILLSLPVVGELLFGAENFGKSLKHLTRYLQFIEACSRVSMTRKTALFCSYRHD
ncbi:MAG: PIN domain-containing protein [Cyanobacteria bacterium P01_H01_bin.21]